MDYNKNSIRLDVIDINEIQLHDIISINNELYIRVREKTDTSITDSSFNVYNKDEHNFYRINTQFPIYSEFNVNNNIDNPFSLNYNQNENYNIAAANWREFDLCNNLNYEIINDNILFDYEQYIKDTNNGTISSNDNLTDIQKSEEIKNIFDIVLASPESVDKNVLIIVPTNLLPQGITNNNIRYYNSNEVVEINNNNRNQSHYAKLENINATLTIKDGSYNVIVKYIGVDETDDKKKYNIQYKNNNTLENELVLKEGEYGIYQTITYFLGSVTAQAVNITNSNTSPVKWVLIEGSMYGNRRF
jgi:hypothetical protein